MDNPIQVDLGRIAQDLQIRRVQVESVVQLLDEGNTVPFITRYRKERTGNLNEVVIHEIQLRVQRSRELAERKETILKAIEAQGKLHPELAAAIRAAENSKRLEDLYLPFKPKKRTKASDARDKGLEPLAVRVWNRDETLTDVAAAAQEFINAEKGVETPEKVLEGVGHILAEAISEMAAVRDAVRKVIWKTGKIVTSKAEIPEGQGLEYRDYFDYSEPVSQVPPHRVLAINRGDKEGPLKVRLEVPRPELEAAFFGQLPLEGHPQAELFRAAAIDALDRLIFPSMEREVRRDLTDSAEKHAVEVFARNLRSLLLQPPIPKQVVMAIDPGLRSGCKVAVLDPHGNLLDHGIVYPHAPQNRRSDAKIFLKDLVGKHGVGVVAIGNGTACRETEELVAEIIAEGVRFSQGGPELAETPPSDASPAVEPEAPAENAPEAVASTAEAEPSTPPEASPATADESQPAAENEVSPPAADESAPSPSGETTMESLPPISGGSPESESSETVTDAGSNIEAAGAPTNDHQPEPQQKEFQAQVAGVGTPVPVSGPVSEPPSASPEPPSEPLAEPPLPEPVPPTESEPVTGKEGQVEVETPAASLGEPAESAAPEAEITAAATAPTAETETAPEAEAATGEAKPAAGGKRGPGKSDQGRSRGPRSKPASTPPPPQAPPAPHPADAQLAQLAYVIVNEAGASVYSASQIGREELPEFDATLRSAISIGRRLQDPLAELVKIEPQNIGVGLYQHDVNPKQLKESLESVISSCVNFVGVDLNTASVPLLRHVSGLNQLTARRIVDFRKEKGAFTGREQLIEVEGIGPATFTQAAGFLKIPEGAHPLDRTWVHPESYEVATKLLEKFGYTSEIVRDKERLPELRAKLAEANVAELAKELETGEFTLRDIIEALGRPERDPRDDLPKPIFKKGILKLEDLTPGMELKGTVLNVVDFGAFVDIGLKDSGLVHISQLANRYIKSPHDVVSVGDVVTVWVMGVDQERKRVSLTMVKPGTERQRGPQAGGRRGGGGEPREGQGRRGGGRGPRPSGSALTSPPVGAAPIASLVEPSPKRHERERGGPPGAPGRFRGGEGAGQGPGGQGGPSGRPGYGRGGPRGGGYQGQGPGGRQERPQGPRGPARPSRPSPPPPPLSKEALSGNVPLRTFGQLKQLWEARVEPAPGEGEGAAPVVQPETQPPSHQDQSAPLPEPAAPAPPAGAAPDDSASS